VNGVLIGGLYAPNGNPIGTPKFAYKLGWLERLIGHASGLLEVDSPVVLAGDYNVIPEDRDAYKPERWMGDALFQPEPRALYRKLLAQGWTDAIRHLHPDEAIFTFWDYWRNAFQRNAGIRIDHFLLNAKALPRLASAHVDRDARGREGASDHAPVWIDLAD
jgi:exodeoxyribonuclease-3